MRWLFPLALVVAACSKPTPVPPPKPAPPPHDDAHVRFVAVGDTGMGNEGQRVVGEAIGRLCAARGCDFVLLLGDNLYPSGAESVDDPRWESSFVQPYRTVEAPFWAVLGNHDYGGNGAGIEEAKAQVEVAYAQKNPKWHLPGTHWHSRFGPVELFGADTNRSLNPTGTFSDAQVGQDFDAWLQASQAPWKVAAGHHPYLSNGPHGNAGGDAEREPFNAGGVKTFLEGHVCGKADVYLAGHDHSQQWFSGTCRGTELVISGGGSAPSSTNHHNPTRFERGGLGFLYVTADLTHFTGEFYDEQGQLEFSRTLTKN
jgi:hypothetical protein